MQVQKRYDILIKLRRNYLDLLKNNICIPKILLSNYKDLKINEKDATAAEFLSYNAQFMNTLFYEAYAEDTASGKIKKYKNVVMLYEIKEFEATCK